MVRTARLVVGAVLAVAVGPSHGEDLSRVPVDPGSICEALRDTYRHAAVEERVSISVRHGSARRSEMATVRFWPVADRVDMELELGPLAVWTSGDRLLCVHGSIDEAFAEQAVVEGDVLGALEAMMPPVPLAALSLVYGDRHGCPSSMSYAKGLGWTEGEIDAESRPGRARIVGTAEGGERVEIEALLEPVRLERFVIEIPAGDWGDALVIEGRVVERGEPAAARAGISLEGRRRVATAVELVPGATALRVGDVIEPLLVSRFDTGPTGGVASPMEPIAGPAVVVMFTEWTRDAALALASGMGAAKTAGGVDVWPVLVLEERIDRGALEARLAALEPYVKPLEPRVSFAPEETIRRVDRHATVALLVIDDRRIVRMTQGVDGIHALDQPDLLEARILAALP